MYGELSNRDMFFQHRKLRCGYLLVLVIVFNVEVASGANSTHGTQLHGDMLKGYNKHVYPSRDYSTPLQVDVMFSLKTIKEFDEKMAKFSVIGFFDLYWNDERMSWTPENYDNISEAMFSQGNVWTPNFILQNSYSMINSLGMEKTPVRYKYDGSATWHPGDVYEISCDADITFYPFDTQRCIIEFVPYGYKKNEITVTAMNNKVKVNTVSPNAIWDIVSGDIVIFGTDEEQFLNIEIVFKRRTSFYIVNVILPMMLMCVLNLIVFLEPFEEGGRVDYATTMLLTIAVFMTTIADTLPESSLPMLPLLCYLIVTHMMISMAILVFTVIGLRIYHKGDDKPVPNWIAKLAQCLLCQTQQCKRYGDKQHWKGLQKGQSKWREYVTQADYHLEKTPSSDDVSKHSGSDNVVVNDNEGDDVITMRWYDVGVAYDIFCIVFFVLLVFTINVLFLVVIFNNYEL